MVSVPVRYVPKNLSKKDKKEQKKELKKSRKSYIKGKYYTRKKVSSFKSKISPHIIRAKKMYNQPTIKPNIKLARATKCSRKGLQKIVKKGQGAYFSSGSRPNQTGHSWGYARLASAITGGKAAAVDFRILEESCKKNSKALRLARRSKKKYKNGKRRVKQVKIGGRGRTKRKRKMKERIVKFIRPTVRGKKYTAIIKNLKTKETHKISFGAIGYQQYKDSTPLKLYSKDNHGDPKRRRNYFMRHSGEPTKKAVVKKEVRKSNGYYNAKILSHIYLW